MARRVRLEYPVDLSTDRDGRVLVQFPDIPEALTDGADRMEALREAEDCLEEAVAGYLRRRKDLPVPSTAAGRTLVAVPFQTATKAALYLAMSAGGISKAELARRLRCDEAYVRRMLNPRHNTRADKLQDALAACGSNLLVVTVNVANNATKQARNGSKRAA